MSKCYYKNEKHEKKQAHNSIKPCYKKSESKLISKAIGLNLLLENIFGKKSAKIIYNRAKKIGCLAVRYGCFEKAYEAVVRYDQSAHKKTETAVALASLATIVAKRGIEYLIKKS